MKYIIQNTEKLKFKSSSGRVKTIDHAKLSGSYFKGTYFGGGGISFGLIGEAKRFDDPVAATNKAKELGMKSFKIQKTFI